MGNQAEQLFGCKLEALRSSRVYLTEQTVPPEIEATIGQVHVFEVKGNMYGDGWNVVSITSSPEEPIVTPPAKPAAAASSSAVPEPTLQTPDKISVERKRGSGTDRRTPFGAPDDKKARRESEDGCSSSSAMDQKDKLD